MAQNLNNNLGKMLRVTPGADGGYSIPAGNPFGGFTVGAMGKDGLGNLYLLGLNGNIYRFATAVSEPAGWALMALGLAGLAAWRRWRPQPATAAARAAADGR